MQNVIYIQVETLAELSELRMDGNFICRVSEDGGFYRGDPDGGEAIKVFDSTGSNYANQFLLMGA